MIRNWGAADAEQTRTLPCDPLLPTAATRLHRAVDVAAPPAVVFRWLCQMKVAPYSYDWVDNLGRRSPRTLTPGVEELVIGERFLIMFALESFEHDVHLTLGASRCAITYAVDATPTGTRLLARMLLDAPIGGTLIAAGDWLMMRKQLLTLKALAER